jgi:hypothetical protein
MLSKALATNVQRQVVDERPIRRSLKSGGCFFRDQFGPLIYGTSCVADGFGALGLGAAEVRERFCFLHGAHCKPC